MTQRHALSLTPDHVAFVHRDVPKGALPTDMRDFTDAEFAHLGAQVLASDPDPDGPLRLFVYGSLIWRPEVAHEAEDQALLHGWHRSFCLQLLGFRGTVDFPGLMMALDRGGRCRGLVFTLKQGDKAQQLDKLLRRELPYTPPGNRPLWVRPRMSQGPVTALAFVANRQSPRYTARLGRDEIADVLAQACGYGGSGAEYLLQTVSHLAARGIGDSLLWDLQKRVATRIEAAMRG